MTTCAQSAAQVCETPIVVINFVLADRQWFKGGGRARGA